jgi:hypothetical protein
MRVAVDALDASQRSFGIQGTVSEHRGDSIFVVETSGRLWSLPVARVQSIDVSQGRDRWRGTGIGVLAGVAFGLVMSTMSPECDDYGNGVDCRSNGTRPSSNQYVQENIGIGVLLGASIGAAVGVERWERIMARPRVSVAPAAGGLGLRLSY